MHRNCRRIAVLLLFVLAFAQVVTAAHACPILNPSPLRPLEVVQFDQAMPTGCAAMAKQAGSTANVCEAHCFAAQQVYAQADAPTAPKAPHPALTVSDCDSFVSTRNAVAALSPVSATPPPLLRFSRFLI